MSKLSDIVPLIAEKTSERKIQWEQLSPTVYMTRQGQNLIEISLQGKDKVLTIRSEAGHSLESLSYQNTSAPIDRMIAEIYDSARRQALGVEDAIDNLKAVLGAL